MWSNVWSALDRTKLSDGRGRCDKYTHAGLPLSSGFHILEGFKLFNSSIISSMLGMISQSLNLVRHFYFLVRKIPFTGIRTHVPTCQKVTRLLYLLVDYAIEKGILTTRTVSSLASVCYCSSKASSTHVAYVTVLSRKGQPKRVSLHF